MKRFYPIIIGLFVAAMVTVVIQSSLSEARAGTSAVSKNPAIISRTQIERYRGDVTTVLHERNQLLWREDRKSVEQSPFES